MHKITNRIVLVFILAAFMLAALVSGATFERLPHLEDEVAYLYQARIFAGGQWVIETPQPHRSYWQPFLINHDGKRFGKYPPGWPLLLSLGVRMGQPWVVNAFCFALAVAVVYRLGRALFGAEAGAVAAGLLTVSPVALLLSGSLMAHTAALFLGVAFAFGMYEAWKAPPGKGWRWAALAGAAAGLLVSFRPLTAVGLALPFGVWGGLAVIWRGLRTFWPWRWEVLAFGAAALPFLALTPAFNMAAVGEPVANLYTMIWEYDRLGFGECCGRSGHTPEKAFHNMRRDLALLSSDLFGWQMHQSVYDWLREAATWRIGAGISWLFVPVGLAAGWRRRWAWVLLGTFGGLVGVHLLYWIGAQTYGPRYYFEGLPALVLLSAAGIAALAQRLKRWPVYALVAVLCAGGLVGYTPARLAELWRFNDIGRDDIAALEAVRDGRPVLVVVPNASERSWRDGGTYLVMTSPYLDSDVVAARVRSEEEHEAVLARFPDRQVVYLREDGTLAADME